MIHYFDDYFKSLRMYWKYASRNLLPLRRKASVASLYARLSPPADSRAFGARFFGGAIA